MDQRWCFYLLEVWTIRTVAHNTGLQIYQWISNNINEFAAISMNLQQYQWICSNINESANISMNLQQYQWICSNINESAAISMNLQQYQWICSNINESANISLCTFCINLSRWGLIEVLQILYLHFFKVSLHFYYSFIIQDTAKSHEMLSTYNGWVGAHYLRLTKR